MYIAKKIIKFKCKKRRKIYKRKRKVISKHIENERIGSILQPLLFSFSMFPSFRVNHIVTYKKRLWKKVRNRFSIEKSRLGDHVVVWTRKMTEEAGGDVCQRLKALCALRCRIMWIGVTRLRLLDKDARRSRFLT